jgi:hypothetical protein
MLRFRLDPLERARAGSPILLSAGPCIRPADGHGLALVQSTSAPALAVALRTGFSTIGRRLFCDSSALAFHITAEFPSGPFLVGIEGRLPATRRSTGGVENRLSVLFFGTSRNHWAFVPSSARPTRDGTLDLRADSDSFLAGTLRTISYCSPSKRFGLDMASAKRRFLISP